MSPLDGIPRALELAAAQVGVFGVHDLGAHLDDRFQVLTSGRRTALPRLRPSARYSIGAIGKKRERSYAG